MSIARLKFNYFCAPEALALPEGPERLRAAYQIYLGEEEDPILFNDARVHLREWSGRGRGGIVRTIEDPRPKPPKPRRRPKQSNPTSIAASEKVADPVGIEPTARGLGVLPSRIEGLCPGPEVEHPRARCSVPAFRHLRYRPEDSRAGRH